ncbi:MAG: sensor histidine kinase [Longimicrobiales bacterium]
MNPTNTRIGLRQLATTLTMTPGATRVLQRLLERVLERTDAAAAFVERAGDADHSAEVIAALGSGAPDIGATPPYEVRRGLRQSHLPLRTSDGHVRGTLVLLDAAATYGDHDPDTKSELQSIVELAADALEVRAVAGALEERRRSLEQAIDERFHLISGITYELRETLGAASEYVQLLDLARVEAGRLPVQQEPTSVGALLRDIARDHQLASATYGVGFEIDVARDLPLVFTDPDLVGQILDTLISNAVRYTPPNGTIRVRADVQRGQRAGDPLRWLRTTITDSGPGVDESYDVFEAVERVSGGRGAPGFRLAISRNVARLLGGDLTLAREPGSGASFSLWLPLPD